MRIKSKFFYVLFASMLVILPVQIATLSSASAAPGSADINVNTYNAYLGGVYGANICNNGDETVSSLDIDFSATNYALDVFNLMTGPGSGTTATDEGTLNETSGVWSGSMENGQCLNVVAFGGITGAVGQSATVTFSVSSSTLIGSIDNIDDPSGNNSSTSGPNIIQELPDMALSTRLTTPGVITEGKELNYETTISNVGAGSSPAGHSLSLAFIVPSDAAYVSVTDGSLSDAVSISADPGCFPWGPPSNAGTGLSGYSGVVVVCILDVNQDLLPGFTTKFNFKMIASGAFASGNATVFGFLSGEDSDSLKNQVGLLKGLNTFETYSDMNNLVRLQYDPNALTATASLCPGQSEITTDGTGCFRVTFNKLIYEESFGADDIDLGGVGDLDSLVQLNSYTWEIRIKNIKPGATLTLQFKLNQIQDFNAVFNETQVLGINTIRYLNDADQLPETGSDSNDWLTGAYFILVGLILLKASQRKQIKSRVHISL